MRTRHGLANGDFDRIARQQNFMRATMGELLGSTKNVVAMTKVINVITKYLTIDATWDNDEIRNLALSMRGINSKDVTFLMAPFGRFDTSDDGQSIVRLAPKKSKLLFESVIERRRPVLHRPLPQRGPEEQQVDRLTRRRCRGSYRLAETWSAECPNCSASPPRRLE